MKLFVVALLVAVAAADRLENTYLPPNSAKTAGGSGNFLNTPFGGGSSSGSAFGSRSGSAGGGAGGAAAYSGPTQAPIGIIRYNNENNGDGTYQFDFETENRIQAQESGKAGESSSVQGSFSYTGDDGQTYSINYVADENGFRPEGAHLPTAPPVPEEILKALEQNAADEAAGIVDDGQYRAEPAPSVANRQGGGGGGGGAGGYGSSGAGGYGGSGSGNAGGAPSRQYLAPKPSSNQGQGGYKY